jgi:hypothetical protein
VVYFIGFHAHRITWDCNRDKGKLTGKGPTSKDQLPFDIRFRVHARGVNLDVKFFMELFSGKEISPEGTLRFDL